MVFKVWGVEVGELVCNVYRFSVLKDEKFLENCCTGMQIYLTLLNRTLKNGKDALKIGRTIGIYFHDRIVNRFLGMKQKQKTKARKEQNK